MFLCLNPKQDSEFFESILKVDSTNSISTGCVGFEIFGISLGKDSENVFKPADTGYLVRKYLPI